MSVHKDKTTGKWYYTGKYKDLSGKRHDYKKRGFRTKGEAKEAEEAFLQKIKGGYGRIKMKDLAELYHRDKKTALKESTLKQYKHIDEIAIIPTFGERFADTIRPSEVREWILHISSEGINGDKYQYVTYKNMLIHLSGLFTFAIERELLKSNPCHLIKAPKNPNAVQQKQKSEENFWQIDEYKQFISYIDDENIKDIYEMLFYTGLRIGEFCVLQWNDFDPVEKKLSITKTLSDRTSKITSPKTYNSIRVIDLPDRLNKRLIERYKRNKKQDGFNDSYYIFADVNYHTSGWYRKIFNEYIEKSGVKRITLHGLRHSHASFLLSNPMISEILIAERLGHSVETLRKTYAHVYEKNRKTMIEYLNNL